MLKAHSLIDKVYLWKNLWTAWRRVRRNKGAHGLDRVTVRAFDKDAETHLRELQRKLMEDRFEPHPVRRVYIPKASNPKQKRPLGIPVVIDRVCQQAIYQVLSPIFDPLFSDRSFGFRPGRKAHHAIATAIHDAKEGFRYVVDADIASFFDRIDHEVVISRVCTRIADGRVIRLLEAFLKAGISDRGIISVPTEGTPQGGVISPLLANIVLDAFDKEIESKGWRHVRYADDFVILTKSPEEAASAMAFAKETLGSLGLSLHETKTRLTDFQEGFEFLGFHFRGYYLGIRARSLEKFKQRVRDVTRRNQGRNVEAVLKDLNPVLRGYANYFGVADVSDVFTDLDAWIRMRIRSFRLKRRTRHANHRLSTRKLRKWGLLSLLECRPQLRLSYMRS
jgi:group II intron reverse transcriptase/maturase